MYINAYDIKEWGEYDDGLYDWFKSVFVKERFPDGINLENESNIKKWLASGCSVDRIKQKAWLCDVLSVLVFDEYSFGGCRNRLIYTYGYEPLAQKIFNYIGFGDESVNSLHDSLMSLSYRRLIPATVQIAQKIAHRERERYSDKMCDSRNQAAEVSYMFGD